METSSTSTANAAPEATTAEAISYHTPYPLQVPPGWTNIEVFRLDLTKLAAFNRIVTLITAGMYLFAWGVTAWMIYFSDSELPPEDRWGLIGRAAIRFAIFGVCMEIFFRWRSRKSKNKLSR